MRNRLYLGLVFLIGVAFWFSPRPLGVEGAAWHLFSLFIATIAGVILRPLPMGSIAMIALTIAVLTKTVTLNEALSGFSNEIVWLVVFAFFISRGFIKSGLGNRIAYKIMSFFGRHSLGVGYGLVLTDLVLAPTIPSVTARIGGVVYPILKSVVDLFSHHAQDAKVGAFLTQTTFQASMITSAMFLTSMAGNPLIAELASQNGVQITWGSWILASIVPGLLSLILVPYLIFWMVSPHLRHTPHAREMAQEKLVQLGSMKTKEWIMFGSFVLLIFLWVVGPYFAIKATVAAMIGLAILLMTKMIQWKDVLEESGAWDTFIWFSVLITFATYLNKMGFTAWFSQAVIQYVEGTHWILGFTIVSLLYFYSHYLFVSCVAHIGAMYAAFLLIAIALGTPPALAALTLGFFSSLMGALTHYGTGQAPILFEMGTMSTAQWWRIGFAASIVNIAIWLVVGGLWWKLLGIW